jgi:hypothetical protein
VRRVHEYLESLPATGKVLSVVTAMDMFGALEPRVLNEDFFLSVFYSRLPPEVKSALFDPYLSEDGGQVRFSIRIYESDLNLRRNELLQEIHRHIAEEMGFGAERVHLSGMMVLYNNMLQGLFRSQILTLGVVFVAIMLMFLVLFRSVRYSTLGILPNLLSAALVLGLMGWARIPLDLMTVTIAAITIGIGVDNTIHYVHRYQEEISGRRRSLGRGCALPRLDWPRPVLHDGHHRARVLGAGAVGIHSDHHVRPADRTGDVGGFDCEHDAAARAAGQDRASPWLNLSRRSRSGCGGQRERARRKSTHGGPVNATFARAVWAAGWRGVHG